MTPAALSILKLAAGRPDGLTHPLPARLSRKHATRLLNELFVAGCIQSTPRELRGQSSLQITAKGRKKLAQVQNAKAPTLPAPLNQLTVAQMAMALSSLTGVAIGPKSYSYKREFTARLLKEMNSRKLTVEAVLQAAGVVGIGASGAISLPAAVVATSEPPTALQELPAPGSKLRIAVDLMQRPQGASLDQLQRATGWQRHSVRGAISGPLQKKFGLTINRQSMANGQILYHITGATS